MDPNFFRKYSIKFLRLLSLMLGKQDTLLEVSLQELETRSNSLREMVNLPAYA